MDSGLHHLLTDPLVISSCIQQMILPARRYFSVCFIKDFMGRSSIGFSVLKLLRAVEQLKGK